VKNAPGRVIRGLAYEIFILLISILSIANLVALALGSIAGAGGGKPNQVILVMEIALTPFFLGDFLYRLYRATSKRRYFFRGLGWADLLSAVPLLRILRIVHIGRVIRTMRRSGRERVFAELDESRAAATFAITIFLVFVVLEVAGASIFAVEGDDAAANIRTPGDTLWWGLVTITTVGYGDQYPVTTGGRLIGVFLLFAGIGLFSVLTGFIANAFLAPRRRRRLAESDPTEAFGKLRGLLDEQQQRSDAIRLQLDELEVSISREKPPPC
jgi:voltage-gated potassium channel Kch